MDYAEIRLFVFSREYANKAQYILKAAVRIIYKFLEKKDFHCLCAKDPAHADDIAGIVALSSCAGAYKIIGELICRKRTDLIQLAHY